MVVGGSLLFSGPRSAAPCSASPSAAQWGETALVLLIPCRDSDADFGTRLPLSLARAGPTRRVRRGVAHTAPPLPLPGARTRLQPLPPAQSRCPTARERLGPRPCPGTALFWPGLPPALSLAQGIRGAASRSEGRAVPVCAGTGRCFRLPSHWPPCPVSSVVPAV